MQKACEIYHLACNLLCLIVGSIRNTLLFIFPLDRVRERGARRLFARSDSGPMGGGGGRGGRGEMLWALSITAHYKVLQKWVYIWR
jgi:hypothetical protein